MCDLREVFERKYWFNFAKHPTHEIEQKATQQEGEHRSYMSQDKHHANPIFIFMLGTCWNFIISFSLSRILLIFLSPTMEIYSLHLFLFYSHRLFRDISKRGKKKIALVVDDEHRNTERE